MTGTCVPDDLKDAFVGLLLSVADDKLLLGHRVGDWTGLAPILEEDIAISSIAQDELAHALALYEHIGGLTGDRPDAVAFGRAPREYRCAAIVEVPDDLDWAVATARQFYCDHFDVLRLARLAGSCHESLAALAGRLVREEELHVEHVDNWIVHLGRGSAESRVRIQAALDRLGPLAGMLFERVDGQADLERAGLYPVGDREMFEQWSDALASTAGRAGLTLNVQPPSEEAVGGRRGEHNQAFTTLLDEMAEVYRLEPNAAW